MNNTFEWIMAVICAVCAFLLLTGRGDGLMKMFGSTPDPNRSLKVEKKRSREDELRYQRALGLFCVLLCVCEVVLAMFGSVNRIVPIVSIGVVILGMVAIVTYMKRKL